MGGNNNNNDKSSTSSSSKSKSKTSTALRGVAALNVYKKVAIIRSSSDVLSYEDTEGNVKNVTDLHLAAAATTPVHKTKPKNDIPVPKIKTVETYKTDIPPNYDCPTSYVRNQRPTQQELHDNIEYVIDAEDEVWLINHPKFGSLAAGHHNHYHSHSHRPTSRQRSGLSPTTKQQQHTTTATSSSSNQKKKDDNDDDDDNNNEHDASTTFPLPLGLLETMMDVMEKATAFEAIIRLDQAEQLICAKLPQLYHMYPIRGAKSGVVTLKHVLTDVYNYWVQKRSKLKRPLLRRFWPVTSSDDTNPHLVFRPREKEKYKLRKKRQNDMDAYRKLTQLKADFEQIRVILKFVQQRELLNRKLVQVQREWFQQKLYDATDTSGYPRVSSTLAKNDLHGLLTVEQTYDVSSTRDGWGKKSKKAKRGSINNQQGGMMISGSGGSGGRGSQTSSPVPSDATSVAAAAAAKAVASSSAAAAAGPGGGPTTSDNLLPPHIVAGHNHGEPAPNFLHPLYTREQYTTSWRNAVPSVTTFVDAVAQPTYHFRHRPRVGRGGRINIDRMPIPIHPNYQPTTIFRAVNATTSTTAITNGGTGSSSSNNDQISKRQPKRRLLDLLPEPLDYEVVSRRIEDICLTSLKEDYDTVAAASSANNIHGGRRVSYHHPTIGGGVANMSMPVAAAAAGMIHSSSVGGAGSSGGAGGEDADNDGVDVVVVNSNDWLSTDDQIWGEERYSIGPV